LSKAKSTQPAKKSSKVDKRKSTTRRAASPGGTTIGRNVHCADFIGRDQNTITYGYTAADLERLVDKVLAFLQAGAAFLPHGDVLRAEVNGDTLIFCPGAVQQLAGRRNKQSYLLSLTVRRDYQIWATKFIPLAAQMDVRREPLDMPIAFSEFHIPREGEGPEARVTTVPLADITEAMDKHCAFVILGEPGAGKTTTLQKIAFEQARQLLSNGEGGVPLFVRLSQQGERAPFDFLKAEWEQRAGSDFADALAAGRVLLLADGINELPRDDRAERLKAWRLFAGDHCADTNHIIFTGREKDYEGQLDLPRVRVEPLDDERIADYLQRNGADGLGELLDDPKTRLREMARNPFNLSLLVAAWRDNQRDMGNRGRLLEWFVGELFAREERLAHRGWLRREVQITALAQLAFAMQEQGESTTLPLKTARAALPQTVEVDGDEIALKPADLFRFARAATLLDPALDQDVRFYHHLLQEYFAALELLQRFATGEELSALWKCKRLIDEMLPAQVSEWDALPEPPATGWEVTTILACGLARDPAQLIEAVRVHNPVLAGRCMDEAGLTARPEGVTTQVRADLLADLCNPAMHLRARLQAGFTLGRVGDPRFEPQIINGVQVIVPQMVNVPAGDYCLGSAENEPNSYDDEKPQHMVDLPAFALGRWPVTNAEFACFIEAGGYKDERYWTTDLAKRWLKGEDVAGGQMTGWMDLWRAIISTPDWKTMLESTGPYTPKQLETYEYMASLSEDELRVWLSQGLSNKSREQPGFWKDSTYNNPSQPVVGVTWFEARAYSVWLSSVSGREYRLPTEVEWEAAAHGTPIPGPFAALRAGSSPVHPKTLDRGSEYPWGDEWDAAKANTIEGRVLKPSPVGAYQAAGGVGPFEAEDQSGNVWEWTSSLYRPYPYKLDDCEDTEAEGERTVRGGSWTYGHVFSRCADRYMYVPVNWNTTVGFRLVSPGSVSGS
jgi:formylglycine-generating enzyme required for sulfatase activity